MFTDMTPLNMLPSLRNFFKLSNNQPVSLHATTKVWTVLHLKYCKSFFNENQIHNSSLTILAFSLSSSCLSWSPKIFPFPFRSFRKMNSFKYKQWTCSDFSLLEPSHYLLLIDITWSIIDIQEDDFEPQLTTLPLPQKNLSSSCVAN